MSTSRSASALSNLDAAFFNPVPCVIMTTINPAYVYIASAASRSTYLQQLTTQIGFRSGNATIRSCWRSRR